MNSFGPDLVDMAEEAAGFKADHAAQQSTGQSVRDILREYQLEAAEEARGHIRQGKKNILIVAPTGSGKCLGRDTPVLMHDGSIKPVQDICIGDRLMGPDSQPRLVGSTARGFGPLYKVTPTKGAAYIVNDAHILSLRMTPGATKWNCTKSDTYQTGKIHNISVIDYLSRSATFRHCAKGWRTGVEFAPAGVTLPLPPYFFGAWLGDGLSTRPSICSADDEVLCELREVASAHGMVVRIETQENNASVVAHISTVVRGGDLSTREENHVLSKLRALGVLGNKHIPALYLTAGRADRLQLLAGLIDTDGTLSGTGFDFIQKNENLSKQVAYLARSLGLAAYLSKSRKTCGNNGKAGEYWRVSISGDCSTVPVRIARKIAPSRVIKKDALVVGIKVDPVGDGEYFGFEIDGDRLFLLGDFTVTHNTVIGAHLVQECVGKGRAAAFVVDRLSLIQQTSDTFDAYGIDHGIIQADHWRFKPTLLAQICSQQTLAKRRWPAANLILVDEAHTVTETVKKRILPRDTITIGLTATPFTKGLGLLYDAVVNVTTTNALIDQGFLAPYRIFSCAEPDMEGVGVVAGEFNEKETSKRALQVVGDVVAEYLKNGEDRKFICSAVDTAHVEELQRQFLAAGINVATYTYKDKDEDRADTVVEFRKPNSTIRGLITVTAASKGFDVPDIGCVIMARPLRSSLAEHIQFLGRGLRICEGKFDCLILDHSGNCARFWHAVNDFFENGITDLDDGTKKPKPKPKPEDEEDQLRKCPTCGHLHKPRPHCPACGYEYPKQGAVEHVPGTLKELVASGNKKLMRKALWPQVCGFVAAEALRKPQPPEMLQSKAQAIYKELTGSFAANVEYATTEPEPPIAEVAGKIKANRIRYAKAKEAERKAQQQAVPA